MNKKYGLFSYDWTMFIPVGVAILFIAIGIWKLLVSYLYQKISFIPSTPPYQQAVIVGQPGKLLQRLQYGSFLFLHQCDEMAGYVGNHWPLETENKRIVFRLVFPQVAS